MGSIFSSVALGWLGRRVLDWGGWLGSFVTAVFGLYAILPPSAQAAINDALQGNWHNITLGAIVPIIALIYSQVVSFRATVKEQVVSDGTKVALPEVLAGLPKGTKTLIEEKVVTVAERRKPNLLERLFGKKVKP